MSKENNMLDKDSKKEVEDMIKKAVRFSQRKVGDAPTDANQLTPRKYVTMNGVSANRPTSSVIGQSYFDTSIGKPIWWDGTGFKDAAGNYV